MAESTPEQIECIAYTDTHIGTYEVHKGDKVKLTKHFSGLWNVDINGSRIPIAIDGTFVNNLTADKLVEM